MQRTILLLVAIITTFAVQAQGISQVWYIATRGKIFKGNGDASNLQMVVDLSNDYISGYLTYHKGKLYGASCKGGVNGNSCLFEIDPQTDTYTEKLILSDPANGLPGRFSMLISDGSKLYGIGLGGSNGHGVLFEWDPETNIYTKKIDFTGITGDARGSISGDYNGGLTFSGNKFLGYTLNGGYSNDGVMFEWDPVTNIYEVKYVFNDPFPPPLFLPLVESGENFYGTNAQYLFEWNPATNIWQAVVLTLNELQVAGHNGKLYGVTGFDGSFGLGSIYEWDPAAGGEIDHLHSFQYDHFGFNPNTPVSVIDNKIYGTVSYNVIEGSEDFEEGGGLIYEYDLVTGIYTRKYHFDPGVNEPFGARNLIKSVPAAVSTGDPGNCLALSDVVIDNTNNNKWVALTDDQGNAVAEIRANGNNLGTVTASLFVHNGPVREDGGRRLYLNRNLTITPEIQPTSPVDIRLYITETEFESLQNATNSQGQPSGINTINDLNIFKNDDGCNASLSATANGIETSSEEWPGGYVLSASIDNFSTFFFANNVNTTLPLEFVLFSGKIDDNDILLNWETANEQQVSHFEVERSSDGNNFESAGTINQANAVHKYSFTDAGIISRGWPVVYYRIRQVDLDGSFTFSQVISLRADLKPAVTAFPNPVKSRLNLSVTISSPEKLQIVVIDNAGRRLNQFNRDLSAGTTNIPLDLQRLANGVYYIEVKGEGINKRIKFLKQ